MKHEFFADEHLARDRRRDALRYRDGAKRLLDLALVAAMAPVAAPLIGVLWCAVRLDGGPGFFGHERVGLGGRRFRCWKLRSMVPDADARLRAHLAASPAAAREWAETYKLRQDPRITGIGRILRKTSLDELPQLWNVFLGEMSLVGPRPVPQAELSIYGGAVWAYTSCRPGVTGVWQISGRNGVRYGDRIRMDIGYLFEMSAMTDLRILLRTPLALIRRPGV